MEENNIERNERQLAEFHLKQLNGCARCGGNHENYTIRQLVNPNIITCSNCGEELLVTFWGTCPVTGEPNFFRVEVSVDESTDQEIRE